MYSYLASAANMTIQELIDSYDYDFNNETINVTSESDYMIDGDSDETDDTLIINLTTDAATEGTFNVKEWNFNRFGEFGCINIT